MADTNITKVEFEVGGEKQKRTPRRIKSFSSALGHLSSSIHNIFEKSSVKRKKRELSKSVQHLSEETASSQSSAIDGHEKCKTLPAFNSKNENGHNGLSNGIVNGNGVSYYSETDTPPSTPQEVEVEFHELKEKLKSWPTVMKTPQGHTVPQIHIQTEDIKEEIEDTPLPSLLAPKQTDNRRASMVWVDYLTEEGVQVGGDDDKEGESRDEFGDEIRRLSDQTRRKIWFGRATESDKSDCEGEEVEIDDDDAQSSGTDEQSQKTSAIYLTKLSSKIRKDSMAVFGNKCRLAHVEGKSPRSTPDPLPNWKWDESRHKNVDDLIFDMFQAKNEEIVQVGNFLVALERTGLRRNDPRLAELFENLKKAHVAQEVNFPQRAAGSIETLRLNREDFKSVITDNIVLISKAFRQQFVIPEFPAFCAHIERMFNQCKNVKGGKVAAYIPQLARVDPNLWGVSICTIDGQRFSIGDTLIPFTVQSCSKPLTYAIALNELGEETVHQYVGQEPSGRMFNELVLDHNKKPHNPMVNAGAIIVCSLLKSMVKPEMSLAEKFDYTQEYFKKLCGGEYVGFNNAVFLSERDAADRNYALGFYMRENKCFPEGTNLKECMDYYFQICSMECNCEAMSVMAATLANGGICPVSGEKVLKSDSVRDVLSLMHSCGMYDYSGQFAFKVGLPAKSGVCGAIMIVVPNVLGMAVWSPPLDALGNTVRGVELCKELVQVFNFHKYDNLRHASHKLDPRRHRYETKGLNIVNLLFSAASGDVTSMRRHHLSGMDMNASDYDGRTALHLAAAEGHLECVVYLLRQCRVTHNPTDRWGHLPVDDSIRFGHDDVTEFLKGWIPIEQGNTEE